MKFFLVSEQKQTLRHLVSRPPQPTGLHYCPPPAESHFLGDNPKPHHRNPFNHPPNPKPKTHKSKPTQPETKTHRSKPTQPETKTHRYPQQNPTHLDIAGAESRHHHPRNATSSRRQPPLTNPCANALDLSHLAPPPLRISPQSPSLLFLLVLVSHFWNGDSFLSCLLILSYVTFLCILSGSITSYIIYLFVFVIKVKNKK